MSQDNWNFKSSFWRNLSFADFLQNKHLQAGMKSIIVDDYNMTVVPGQLITAGHRYITGFKAEFPSDFSG